MKKAINNAVTFIVLQKEMRSMHSRERDELEGYRWDAILLCEMWNHDKAEVWEIHHKHIFMGAGKYDNEHGVCVLLNKKWRQGLN